MIIKGLQKLTLLDYPEKVAATVFTFGCNFRCPFCHNALLVVRDDGEYISEQEFFDFLKSRVGILDGVCVTGGEPLLQPDIKSFLSRIRDLGFAVKLDTNGSRFELLNQIIDEKLVDYVAMDVKNSLDKYSQTIGVKDFDTADIEKSVALLIENRVPYEFRTTVVSELHDRSSFIGIGKLVRGAEKLFLQGFVDSGELIGASLSAATKQEMQDYLETVKPFVKRAELRGIK